MGFLPNDYKQPPTISRYLKFAVGDNKFRILSKAITGWIDWKDKQPIRTKDQPKQAIDPKRAVKHFWAFVIYDYREENIKILEITQRGIQDDIINLYKDVNWGDPQGYDLNIKREGQDFQNTKYTVIPTPPREASEFILKQYTETKVNLEALFINGDPFTSEEDEADNVENQEPVMNENIPPDPMQERTDEAVDNLPLR